MRLKPASFTRLFVLVWLFTWSVLANAVVVEDLYQAQVPVTGQGEDDRKEALGRALSQVAVKVSGRGSAAEQASVKEAAAKAQQLVAQFAFEGAIGSAERTLRASFSKSGIDKLLTEAGLPVWGSNRPALVTWVAVEQDGRRELLGGEAAAALTSVLERTAAQRGVPLVMPLMDLEDSGSVSVADVWGLSAEAVKRASRRYSHDAVLMGQVASTQADQWQAQWQVLVQNEVLSDSVKGASLEEALQNLVGSVAERLASRYAVRGAETVAEQLEVEVSGVESLEDYAALTRFLNSVGVVRSAQPVLVQPTKIRYGLMLQGSVEQVQEYLALERRLQLDTQTPQTRPTRSGTTEPSASVGGTAPVTPGTAASQPQAQIQEQTQGIQTQGTMEPAIQRLYYLWKR